MKRFLFLCGVAFLLSINAKSVLAHSIDAGTYNMELGTEYFIPHTDADPYKGTITLSVTNIGTEDWGDFHFFISGDYSNVIFTEGSSSITDGVSAYTSDITSEVEGLYLNFYFYSDPVINGESLTFNIYTDNTTDQVTFFSVCMKASPVPVPGAVWLLGSCLLGTVGVRRFER